MTERKEVPIGELGARRDQPKLARFDERERALDAREKAGEDVAIEREELGLDREIFYYERDNTGAVVRDRWGTDIAESFRKEGGRLDKLGPDGKVAPREGDERRHMVMVAMAELDRLNDEGGHGGGDAALEQTSSNIEAEIEAVLADPKFAEHVGAGAKYEVYRYGGNQYALDIEDVSPEGAAEIMRRIKELSPERRIPDSLRNSVKEAPPLIVSGLNREQQVSMLNAVQEKLGAAGLATYGEGKDAQRAMIDLIQKAADLDMDIDKFANRAERVMEKLARGDGDTDAFFEKYMKKGLAESAFDSVDAFKAFLGPDGKPTAEFAVAVRAEAQKNASKWLALNSAKATARDAELAKAVAELRGAPELRIPKGEVAGATSARELPRPALEGLGELRRLEHEAEEGVGGPEAGVIERRAKLEKAKRDSLTGLEKRRSFYLDLRERITPDKEGKTKDTSVVFIDMAFLKYFDKEGGPAVGDAAIKQAAWALEEVQRRMAAKGIEVKAHRYAGDEFAFTVDGDHEQAKLVTEELVRVSAEIPPLPRQAGSTDSYVDASLSFNFGVADVKDLAVLEKRMREQGLVPPEVDTDPAEAAKWRSEMLTTMADAGVKEQKAINRFAQLYAKLTDEEAFKETLKEQGFTDEQIEKGVRRLVDYSEKALFNKGADLQRWATEEKIDIEELLVRAEREVRGQQAAELKEKREKRVITDLVIESGVHEARFDREIAAAARQLREAEAQYGQEHAQVADLRERMTKLEKEKEDMVRKFLGGLDRPS